MNLDIWSTDDIRNVILAANASIGTQGSAPAGEPMAVEGVSAYREGYRAALIHLATSFGIPLAANGQLRTHGVVIPASRLSVSYRAEMALARLLGIER